MYAALRRVRDLVLSRPAAGGAPSRMERRAEAIHLEMWPPVDAARFRAAKQSVEASGGHLGAWALAESSLAALVTAVKDTPSPRVCEFGAGMSTRFLQAYYAAGVEIDAFEHQAQYAEALRRDCHAPGIRIHERPLLEYSQADRIALLASTLETEVAQGRATPFPSERYGETRTPNLFYAIQEGDLAAEYDAVILDGPNGDGRSLAFPYLRERLRPGSLVLIDDCNHYPFVSDFSRFFRFEILGGAFWPMKRWVLFQVLSEEI